MWNQKQKLENNLATCYKNECEPLVITNTVEHWHENFTTRISGIVFATSTDPSLLVSSLLQAHIPHLTRM